LEWRVRDDFGMGLVLGNVWGVLLSSFDKSSSPTYIRSDETRAITFLWIVLSARLSGSNIPIRNLLSSIESARK
jgi:hypothetical protein